MANSTAVMARAPAPHIKGRGSEDRLIHESRTMARPPASAIVQWVRPRQRSSIRGYPMNPMKKSRVDVGRIEIVESRDFIVVS
jgi:hypothetical protein